MAEPDRRKQHHHLSRRANARRASARPRRGSVRCVQVATQPATLCTRCAWKRSADPLNRRCVESQGVPVSLWRMHLRRAPSEWGSAGRGFKSRRPDRIVIGAQRLGFCRGVLRWRDEVRPCMVGAWGGRRPAAIDSPCVRVDDNHAVLLSVDHSTAH